MPNESWYRNESFSPHQTPTPFKRLALIPSYCWQILRLNSWYSRRTLRIKGRNLRHFKQEKTRPLRERSCLRHVRWC
jgi:hypothetical protein